MFLIAVMLLLTFACTFLCCLRVFYDENPAEFVLMVMLIYIISMIFLLYQVTQP